MSDERPMVSQTAALKRCRELFLKVETQQFNDCITFEKAHNGLHLTGDRTFISLLYSFNSSKAVRSTVYTRMRPILVLPCHTDEEQLHQMRNNHYEKKCHLVETQVSGTYYIHL